MRLQACLDRASDASAAGRLYLDHVPDVGALLSFERLPSTQCGCQHTDAEENGEQRWRASYVRSSIDPGEGKNADTDEDKAERGMQGHLDVRPPPVQVGRVGRIAD